MVDQDVPCGFTLLEAEFSHTARLDMVSVVCSTQVQLDEDGAGVLQCTISGSEEVEPTTAVWYKGECANVIARIRHI